MIAQMLWLDPECEPTHECPLCGRECFGEICERCRERLDFDEPETYYE